MAEKCGFFPATLVGGVYDRLYSHEDYAARYASMITTGLQFATNALKVTSSGGMNVSIAAGNAWINGYNYSNTAAMTKTLEVANGLYPRIDRVVIRFDMTERIISTIVITGVAASAPVAPVLSRDALIYDLCLAEIAVAAGVIQIVAGNVTDKRADENLCGWAKFIGEFGVQYVDDLVATCFKKVGGVMAGNIDMNSLYKILNLPAPTLVSDAVNKGYVDDKVVSGALSSYIAFCANVNENSLNAAFGKNNEDIVSMLGKQMAMYSWYNGKNKLGSPYTNLLTKNTLAEINADVALRESLVVDATMLPLILASGYACSAFFNLANPLSDVTRNTILFSETLRNLVFNSAIARTALFGKTRPVVIYDKGDEKPEIMNGFTVNHMYGGTGTKFPTYFTLTGSSNGGMGLVEAVIKFPLTNFNRCDMNIIENVGDSNYFNFFSGGNVNYTTLGTGLKTIPVSITSGTSFHMEIYYFGARFTTDYIAFYCV